MRIRTTLQVTLIAILVSIVVIQACGGNGTSSTASSTSRSDFATETRMEVDELEIKPEMRSNLLKMKMSLDSGRLVFRLSSPDGHVQWEEAFTAPADYQHTFDLEVTPGIWKLEIELENATGNYDIQWKASN